jgi:HK97 family phage portal protein
VRLLGFEVSRSKAAPPVAVRSPWTGGLFGVIRESFAGAWQRNITVESRENLMAFSAVFSCVTRIAEDIGKLCVELVEEDDNGIWSEVESVSPFAPVLIEPNTYQTWPQFMTYWLTMKMMYGNAYVAMEKDARGVVKAMHVMDSRQVTPLIADDGSVFYSIRRDDLGGFADSPALPQSVVMHDRFNTIWHPLVGVSPIYACGASATQGIRIQANSASFFENMSRPSGMLTAPGTIPDDTADRLKRTFEEKFSGANLGRLFVGGDGLKYEPMTIPAVDAQLIEQLKWTVEDVARCFHVPLHKIGAGAPPTFNNIGALNQDYYQQTLQPHIEAIEWLLEDGLNLRNVAGKSYSVRFDLDGLLRMDQQGLVTSLKDAVGAGVMAPNEARAKLNLGPVAGGDAPYLQQQNYSLEDLAKRGAAPADAPKPAPAEPSPTAPANDAPPPPRAAEPDLPADVAFRKLMASVRSAAVMEPA